MGNQQERLAFNIGWIVGLIDGEGSILITKKKIGYYPSIQIGNCRIEVVTKIKEVLSNLEIPYYICPLVRTKANKDFHRIDVGGFKRLIKFFEILPIELFECKADEMWLLKKYLEIRASKSESAPFDNDEHSIFCQLKGYNGR